MRKTLKSETMEFNISVQKYLTGLDFSNGLAIDISKKEELISDRFSILEQLSKGKKIIHIGCCDHIPLIQNKIKNNIWLHSRLCNNSKRCIGIDINDGGINHLRNNLGYEDVLCGDIIEEDLSAITEEHWDYMILGEILEHVDNPNLFLSTIQNKYHGCVDHLVITVPNAFSYQNMKYTFSNKECINTDHRYWFTPFILAKIAILAGMQVERFFFCIPTPRNNNVINRIHPQRIFSDFIFKRYPSTRQTLVMVVAI